MNIKARQRKKQHGVENAKKDNKKNRHHQCNGKLIGLKKHCTT